MSSSRPPPVYAAPTVLRGEQATSEAVLQSLSHVTILHFAGHAVTRQTEFRAILSGTQSARHQCFAGTRISIYAASDS